LSGISGSELSDRPNGWARKGGKNVRREGEVRDGAGSRRAAQLICYTFDTDSEAVTNGEMRRRRGGGEEVEERRGGIWKF